MMERVISERKAIADNTSFLVEVKGEGTTVRRVSQQKRGGVREESYET